MTLEPGFDPDKTEYTVETSNASNKVTAVAAEGCEIVEIQLNDVAIDNESSASWIDGPNTLTVKVKGSTASDTYTVIVTKATEPVSE